MTTFRPPLTEKMFQAQVLGLARLNGWWVYHTHNSKRSEPGFPDLVLARAPELIYAEIKTETGRLTEAQRVVLDLLGRCNAEVYVWRPSNWDAIAKRLMRTRQ